MGAAVWWQKLEADLVLLSGGRNWKLIMSKNVHSINIQWQDVFVVNIQSQFPNVENVHNVNSAIVGKSC